MESHPPLLPQVFRQRDASFVRLLQDVRSGSPAEQVWAAVCHFVVLFIFQHCSSVELLVCCFTLLVARY